MNLTQEVGLNSMTQMLRWQWKLKTYQKVLKSENSTKNKPSKKMVSFGQKVLKTKCGIPTPLVETKLGSHKSLEPIIRCTKVIICIWSRVDLIYGSDMCATLKKIKSGAKILVMPILPMPLFYFFIYPFFLAPACVIDSRSSYLCKKKGHSKLLIIFL